MIFYISFLFVLPLFASQLIVFISQQSACSVQCDGSLSNPFSNLTEAHNFTYFFLLNNFAINNVSFQFLGENFTVNSSNRLLMFFNWEQNLSRDLWIEIRPQSSLNFSLILNMQNITFYATKSFTFANMNIDSSGNLGLTKISRSLNSDRAFFEILNNLTTFLISNSSLKNMFSLDPINYYSYFIRINCQNSFVMISDSFFQSFYFSNSFILISSSLSLKNSIFLKNSTFKNYNPFSYFENLPNQTFSYLIASDNVLNSIKNMNNLTITACQILNYTFYVKSYLSINCISDSTFTIKIRSTSLNTTLTSGVLFFGSSSNVFLKNCTFLQGGNIPTTITGINRIALIYTSDLANLSLSNCNIVNLTLREGRLILAGSNSSFFMINNTFLNLFHRCYESTSSNCQYYLFDFNSYNMINFTNCTFSNVTVQSDTSLVRFFGVNNVTILNSIFSNFGLLLNPGTYLIYVYSKNFLYLENVIFLNYTVGFSAGFFYLDNNNLMILNISIFNAYNLATNSGQTIYLSSTNQLLMYGSTLQNLYSVFRNNVWVLQKNYVYYENCYIYNVTGSRGGLSSISNNLNTYIINQSVILWPQCVNQGAVTYVIISNNYVKISSSKVLNAFAKQDGGAFYVENLHTFVIENTVIAYSIDGMYGGILSVFEQNIISINNLTAYQSESLSNAAALNILKNNKFQMTNSTFSGGSSDIGRAGVFYAFIWNDIVFDKIVFQNNSALDGGSLVIENSNIFTMTNSLVNNSIARTGDAGFLLITQNNSIQILNCTVTTSYAAIDAGFLKALLSNFITFISISFVNIKCLRNGGVFYFEFGNFFSLQNCSVIQAIGTKGGLIYASNNNTISLTNNNFSQISVSLEGGGIYGDKLNNISVLQCNFQKISNTIENGGLFYFNYENFVQLFQNTISFLSSNSLGTIVYCFQNNSIQILQNSFNSIYGPSFFYLNEKNYLYLKTIIIINNFYFGFLAADKSNNVGIFELSFKTNNSSFPDFLIAFNENNSGNISNSSFILQNSLISNIYLVTLTNSNSLFINSTILIFDYCEKLFFVAGGSFLRIISFHLKNFTTETLSFIDIYDSNFTAENIFLKHLKLPLFLNSINSSIFIENFTYQLSLESTPFIWSSNSQISLNKGFIIREKSFNKTQLMAFTNSSLRLYKLNIHGWQFSHSGGVATLINSSLAIIKSVISINKCFKNGGVFALMYSNYTAINNESNKNYKISCRNTIFCHNKASDNGSVFHIDNQFLKYEISIENTSFLNNQAQRGGSFYVANFENLTVSTSLFSSNRAFRKTLVSKGGSLFLINNRTTSNPRINLSFSTFKSNLANIGGFLYIEGINIQNLVHPKNKYFRNKADFYGNDFASETYTLNFFSQEKSELAFFPEDHYTVFHLNEIKSGVLYPNCLLQMNGYDRFGSITYRNDEDLLAYINITQLSPEIKTNFFSFKKSEKGFICLTSPINRKELPLQIPFLYRFSTVSPLNPDQSFAFYLNFKSCDIGDVLNQENLCVPCAKDSYSFVTDFSTYSDLCKTCINQDFNCFGGGNYTPKPGFWRVSADSPLFYRCLNSEACLGDPRDLTKSENSDYMEIYATGICATGYFNNLCALCVDGYGITSGNVCVSCDNQNYYWNVFGNLAMRIIFAVYLISIAINMCISLMNEKPIISRIAATNLLKILTNHMQILGIILKLPVNISNQLVEGIGVLLSVSPNISEAFSIQCVLKEINVHISLAYFKLITTGIYPIVLIFFYLMFLRFTKFLKKNTQKSSIALSSGSNKNNISILLDKRTLSYKEVIITVFSLVCLTCYADISNMALSMFGCVNFSDGKTEKSLLYSDLSIDCNGNYHQLWIKQLCIPIIIFFMLIYPCYIVISIARNVGIKSKSSKNLQYDGKFYFRFGYFFYAYQRKFFFWDFIILIRKLLLILVNHIFFTRVTNTVSYSPIILMLLLITLAFLAQIYCKPFQKPTFHFINYVEEASLVVSFVTVALILILISAEISDLLSSFLLVVGFLINLFFFIWWFKNYYDFFMKQKILNFVGWLSLGKKLFGGKSQEIAKSSAMSESKTDTIHKKHSTISVKVFPKTVEKSKIKIVQKVDSHQIKFKEDSKVDLPVIKPKGNEEMKVVDVN